MNIGRLSLENIEKYGEYTSLHFEGKAITNVEQDLYASSLAAVLRGYNVEPGDRVVVMMPNTPEILASFQAVWKIGAVIVPVTPMLNPREVGYIIDHADAKVALTTPVLAARVSEASKQFAGFKHLLVIGETKVDGAIDISEKIKNVTAISSMAERADEDMAILLYTSGTTGHPKGVMLTHANLLSNAHATTAMGVIEPGLMGMHILPLSHAFGIMVMNAGYIVGSAGVLLTHFEATKALKAIQDHKVKRFAVVPTMLTFLINHPDRTKYDTSSLERVSSGGAALPNEVRLEFERLFKCEVFEGYGLSETSPTSCAYRDGEAYRPGSVGRAIPDVDVCIMDFDNQKIEVGQQGEICIKGPNIMKGYWKNEEATHEAIIDGWFHSGDIGYMDADGFVYITDRKKDIIIKGGENISPREIEEAIYEHPSVAECAVVAVPDEAFGENLAAVIVNKPGHSAKADEILEHISKYVTKFKVPAYVHFSPYLPKNPTGKILKKDLRKTMADWVVKEKQKAAAAPKV